MAIGNPITLTSNVASKTISAIATAGQTLFTVTGGYRINQLAVFRNGVRLLDSRDYEARNGSTVTLLSAATVGDALEFQVFDDFRVADAIVSAESEQTIQGNLNVAGILTATNLSVTDLSLRHLKATGISTVSDTTQTTSTTTGALVVSGGVGIAKSLFVGGDMSVAGTLTYEDVTNTETAGVTTTGGLVVTGLGATFGSGVGIADSIYHIDDSNTAIRFPAADTFTVETAGAETLRIIGVGGSIGINETTPDSKVDIVHSTAENSATENLIHLRSDPSGSYVTRGLFVKIGRDGAYDNSAAHYDIVGSSGNSGFHVFEVQGDEKLRITKDGRLGIGTAEPTHPLVVDADVNQFRLCEGANGFDFRAGSVLKILDDGTERLRIDANGHMGLSVTPSAWAANGDFRGLQVGGASLFGRGSGDEDRGGIAVNYYHTGSAEKYIANGNAAIIYLADGNIHFSNAPANSSGADAAMTLTERLRIDTSGRLLLGTTVAPSSTNTLLRVHCPISSSNADAIQIGQNTDGADKTAAALAIAVQNGGESTNAADLIFKTASGGSSAERLRIDSSGRLLQGKTATKGSTGENIPTYCNEIAANNPNVLEIANNGTGANAYSALVLSRSDGTSVNSHTAVDSGDKIGEVCFIGADGADRFNTAASIHVEAEADFTANDCPARLILATNAGGASVTERLRIDSRGSFQFSNGFMNETVKINTTARNGTQAVNLDDGMVHYFQSSSTGTWKPNFTMSSGNDINATIATGDTFSVTMIVNKGATTHFANAIQVDGSDVSPDWLGGAPTDGGGNNTWDIYHYTIIKTGDDTFKCWASVSTYE